MVRFFAAFNDKQQQLVQAAYGGCPCEACTHIDQLRLKAFLHRVQVIIKQVRQFTELAGEDVILIHRLLKNGITSPEYIMMTTAFHELSGDIPALEREEYVASCKGLGEVKTVVFYPQEEMTHLEIPTPTKPMSTPTGIMESMRLVLKWAWGRVRGQHRTFRHLPLEN